MNSTITSLLESSENKDFIRPDIESETIKKIRKKRESKISALDKLGWDSSLSWSLPRFKKYMNNVDREIIGIKNGISFKSGSDECESLGGIVLTVQRGPRVEDILIITEFCLDWINNEDFISLIKPFTSTSKSSKFILISPYSKSWGKSKVAIGNKMLNKIIADHWDVSIPTTILDMESDIGEVVGVKKLKNQKKLYVSTVISTNLNIPKAELCEVRCDQLKSILVNFSNSINKVVESFKNLKESLELVTNLGKDIEGYLGNK